MKSNRTVKMGIKTYNYVKYLATLGSILLLIIPVIVMMFYLKDWFGGNVTSFKVTTGILLTVGETIIATYIGIRWNLYMASGYQHEKKERNQLIFATVSYAMAILSGIIFVLIINLGNLVGMSNVYVSIGFLVLFLLLNSVAAVFETFSRVGEQRFLYNQNEAHKDDLSVSDMGVERTKEAQDLLAKAKKKPKKVETLEDKDLLDDFFNQDDKENK